MSTLGESVIRRIKRHIHLTEKNISFSGCIGRPLNLVKCIWRRHWFKITWLFCDIILTNNLQVVLHFSLLGKYTCPNWWESISVFKDVFGMHCICALYPVTKSLLKEVYKDRQREVASVQTTASKSVTEPFLLSWEQVCSDNCTRLVFINQSPLTGRVEADFFCW